MRNPPLGASWAGPWTYCVPGFVAVTRSQALKLREVNPGAKLWASLWAPPLRKGKLGVLVKPRAEYLYFARAEDLVAAGLPSVGRGWRGSDQHNPR